jgi:Amt family ammonium transporter
LLTSTAVNANGKDGLFLGNVAALGPQIVGILATWIYAAVLTWIILKVLDTPMGLRVSSENEQMGLDLNQHNEAGYTM